MEQHLERALIELIYALAEFEKMRTAQDWSVSEDESLAFASVLRTTRYAVGGILRRSRDLVAEQKLSA